MSLSEWLRQLRHISRDSPRFILGERLRRRASAGLILEINLRERSIPCCDLALFASAVQNLKVGQSVYRDKLGQVPGRSSDAVQREGNLKLPETRPFLAPSHGKRPASTGVAGWMLHTLVTPFGVTSGKLLTQHEIWPIGADITNLPRWKA